MTISTVDITLLQATVDKLLRSSRRAESLLGELLDRDRENMNFRVDTRASFKEVDDKLDDISQRLAATINSAGTTTGFA
jgi:hypothetical protein